MFEIWMNFCLNYAILEPGSFNLFKVIKEPRINEALDLVSIFHALIQMHTWIKSVIRADNALMNISFPFLDWLRFFKWGQLVYLPILHAIFVQLSGIILYPGVPNKYVKRLFVFREFSPPILTSYYTRYV